MTIINKLCPHCMEHKDTSVEDISDTYDIRGDSISVTSQVIKCHTCLNHFNDNNTPETSIPKAFEIYRERHSLLTPKDLCKFRNDLRLSLIEMSDLTGISATTWKYYETGALIDAESDYKIKRIMTKKGMISFLKERQVSSELVWKIEKWL